MGLGDLLKGKEKKIKADPLAGDINAAGKSGLAMMNSAGQSLNNFYDNPSSYIDSQIGLENNAIRSAAIDAQRRTNQLLANRGMQNSSVGLGTEVNQARQTNEKLALNNATGMERLKGLLNEKMQTGNQLFGVKASQGPVQMTDVKYRTGGIAGLVGAAAGGYLGGAEGAKVGMSLGNAYANS